MVLSICPFVCVSVSVAKIRRQTRFSQKLSNLELWSLLTTNWKSYVVFFKEPIIGLLKFKITAAILKNYFDHS